MTLYGELSSSPCKEAIAAFEFILSAASLRPDPLYIKDQLIKIKRDVRQKPIDFNLKDTPHLGNPDAPIKIVEFADFQCPYCRLASQLVERLYNGFKNDVVVFFKNFPLRIHKYSKLAAYAVLAAGRQGKFWQMHALLFKNQESLDDQLIKLLAKSIGLDMKRFEKDLSSKAIKDSVDRDLKEGLSAGVRGTPTFFVNGKPFSADITEESFRYRIYLELERARSGKNKNRR